MKICDITQAYAPTGGGIRTYLHEKQRFIRDCTEHEYLLIVPGAKDSASCEGRLSTVTIAGPMIPKCQPYRFLLRLDKVLAVLAKHRPDVIELGTGYALPLAVLLHRRRHPCVFIGFYHTDYPSAYIEPLVARLLGKQTARHAKRLAESYVRFIHRQCDVTVTSSAALQYKLRLLGVPSVERIPLGVDLELFNPGKRDNNLRRRLGIADDDLMLINAGRLDAEKRIDLLMQAFERLPATSKAHLVFVGEGPLKQTVQQRASNHPRLHLLPFQDERGMLARLLASADIYVTAGPFETFALSVLEAQASGLPVVGVRAGALIERVPKSTGLLAPVDSADDFARHIEELSMNGYRRKGQNARQLVEREFSWQRTFTDMIGLYEKHLRQAFPAQN